MAYPPPPSYHQQNNNSDRHSPAPSNEDLDLADAPGDDDDQQPEELDREMLDPDLRDKHSVMKGGGGDGDGGQVEYAGGRMLMGLREYDGVGMGNGGG